LSGIPDLTAAVGVPRLAGIEYPLGYLMGKPCDRVGQLAVLRAILNALADAEKPGTVIDIPFEWPSDLKKLNAHPSVQPPISKYLLKHPWQIPNLLSRNIPTSAEKDWMQNKNQTGPSFESSERSKK
jgi:hypothetical protein